MTRVALTFPGQGSQAAGMADGLFDLPVARELLDSATSNGLDLVSALAGDERSLRPTEIAQPALLFTEVVLASQLPIAAEVVAVAGHSVGEYSAAVVSGALKPQDAMHLVIERGRLMAASRFGQMAALLGGDILKDVEKICDEVTNSGRGLAVVANDNAPGQVVISGDVVGMAAVVEAAGPLVKRVVNLPVSGAFHSPLMADAAQKFAVLLDSTEFADPQIPIICNTDARAVRDATGLRSRLREQLLSRVRWRESVASLQGFDIELILEVGPGAVLSGLAKKILPELPRVAVNTSAEAHKVGLGEGLVG